MTQFPANQILLFEKVVIVKWARGDRLTSYVKRFRIKNVHSLFDFSKSKRV